MNKHLYAVTVGRRIYRIRLTRIAAAELKRSVRNRMFKEAS